MEANVRRRGRNVRMKGGGQGRGRGIGRGRTSISNEIHATVLDHVLVHGMTMREAGLRVQPNLSRFTVASIVRTFRDENRYHTMKLYFYVLQVSTMNLYALQ